MQTFSFVHADPGGLAADNQRLMAIVNFSEPWSHVPYFKYRLVRCFVYGPDGKLTELGVQAERFLDSLEVDYHKIWDDFPSRAKSSNTDRTIMKNYIIQLRTGFENAKIAFDMQNTAAVLRYGNCWLSSNSAFIFTGQYTFQLVKSANTSRPDISLPYLVKSFNHCALHH